MHGQDDMAGKQMILRTEAASSMGAGMAADAEPGNATGNVATPTPRRAPRPLTATLAFAVALAAGLAGAAQAAELKVEDGVVVKMGPGAALVVRDRLTLQQGATFTSVGDDTAAGQLTATPGTAAQGDWAGVRIEKTARGQGTTALTGLGIRHAGADDGEGLLVRSNGLTLTGLQVNNSGVGLRVGDGGNTTLTASSLAGNRIDLLSDAGGRATVTGSQLVGSSDHAIKNEDPTAILRATGNWWGHASGPLHPQTNPQGQGGQVSDRVNHADFLRAQPLLGAQLRLAAPKTELEDRLVSLRLGAINATGYRLIEDDKAVGSGFTALTAGSTVVEHTLGAGDGLKQLTVEFRNAAGTLATATLAGGVRVDSAAPELRLDAPMQGALLSSAIMLEATATDASGISKVEYFVDDRSVGSVTTAPYRLAWDPASVSEGRHVVRVVASDAAGRTSAATAEVTVGFAPPAPDVEGPELGDVRFEGGLLASGVVFTGSSTLSFTASDRSAVAYVELLLDGRSQGNASLLHGRYSIRLPLDGVAIGEHVLGLRAVDSLGNAQLHEYTVVVAHAPPAAPQFSQPANNSTVRTAAVVLQGTALAASTINATLNGDALTAVQADAGGRFALPLTLVPGANRVRATASDGNGASPASVEWVINLDSTVPGSPGAPTVTAVSGRIRINWTPSSDPNAVAHEVHRANSEFATVNDATRIASLAASANQYEDQPEQDGQFFYRVVAVNAAGTRSLPSAIASATLDRTAPQVVRIDYTPQGAYDATRKVFGQGAVGVRVTMSEPLQGTPYLSLVPTGGMPIPVDLVMADELTWTGTLQLQASAGSGTVNVLFSARDKAGNRGDVVRDGASIEIDTLSPAVASIALQPGAPIDVVASRTVAVEFAFSEAVASAQQPVAQYRLSGAGRAPTTIALSRVTDLRWSASFELPADAGLAAVEVLSFDVIAEDALGNRGSRIEAANRFQVYQGDLPALDVPLSLRAVAASGGKVNLEWQAVDGASQYQILRQAPGETARTPLARVATPKYVDSTPTDGRYRYSVASLRLHNGVEAISGESSVAEVDSARNAPGAPQNLQLSLTAQGVLAAWQPPVGTAPASYRLYRSSAASITSVVGLTPIREGIRQAQVVDAAPSPSEHAYVVTAVDAAGNESAISNSAYLNFNLLPVRTIKVEQHAAELPVLSWTAASSAVSGYEVYVGEGDARVRLTSGPVKVLQWTDTGFTGGNRLYTVEAVDENGERQPRSLRLPSVSTQIVSGLPLKRNVMNRVNVQVSNLSGASLASGQVVLSVGTRRFASERFTLPTNGTQVVPVVVGGHADIPGSAELIVAVENIPAEGEHSRVSTARQVSVVDSALVVGLESENFVRGASGKVRLSVENTSDVQVELLTARGNGQQPSNELRLKLVDKDGNLMASVPYQQGTGAGVITLANGETVARIAPGQRYVSDTFLMPVPVVAPDQLKLRLEVDALRYNSGETDALKIAGMGSERAITLSNTPYSGSIDSVSPVVSFGQDELAVVGKALDRDTGAPVGNARLRIAINQEGFERLADVTSDAAGAFRYAFTPTITDSGLYSIAAIHPDMTDRPQQAQFTINRVSVSPASFKLNVPRNYAYRIDFRATTGAGARAQNLRIVYAAQYQADASLLPGIKVEPSPALEIGPRQNLTLSASVSGDSNAAPSGRLFLAVLADGASRPLAIIPVDYTLTEATPALFSQPNYVEAGLSQGQSTIETVVLENRGFVAMTELTAALVTPDGAPAPAWISLASSPVIGTLGIGDKRSLDIHVAPTAAVGEGIHEFRLRVQGSNLPAEDVNVFVSVTQSGQGSVLFKAADIYTATRDKAGNLIPGLAGARLTLQNEAVISQNFEATTDAFGEAFLADLPAGSYRYRASAPNHQEAAGRVVIKPGLTVNQPVFLEYTLITVEWDVREITIEDRYEITLNATFETDVPAPVVVIQPTSINLPKMAAGEVFQGELVLTNYGLVRADSVHATLPTDDDYFKYEFLATPPASLEAKQRIRLPYRIIALRSLDGDDVAPEGPAQPEGRAASAGGAGSASGSTDSGNGDGDGILGLLAAARAAGAVSSPSAAAAARASAAATSGSAGCRVYTNTYRVGCKYECANGQISENCGSGAQWFRSVSVSCPVGGGGGGGGWVGGGGSGGSGGPGYSGMPGLPMCVNGNGDCGSGGDKASGGGKEGGK